MEIWTKVRRPVLISKRLNNYGSLRSMFNGQLTIKLNAQNARGPVLSRPMPEVIETSPTTALLYCSIVESWNYTLSKHKKVGKTKEDFWLDHTDILS